MMYYITLALSLPANVYGLGEYYCGDYDTVPVPCDSNAVMANGENLDPDALIAAIPLPRNKLLRPAELRVRTHKGTCVTLRIVDKKNERYIGVSGFDITPAAVYAITGVKATHKWSGTLKECAHSKNVLPAETKGG